MSDITVLITDDQEIVRRGIAVILEYAGGITVVGQAGNGEEAIAKATELQPDVVLMDIKMPVLGGIPATRRILAACPNTRVILLTTYDTDDLIFEGIKAGAQGYLLKDSPSEELVAAVRGVHAGESRLDNRVAGRVMEEFRRMSKIVPQRVSPQTGEGPDLVIEPLTEREQQVLELLVQGLQNKEIAERLFLTEGTVKNYVSVIIGKLQANDRTHAVITALRHGLVEL
ncbi:MAG: response regulator transcription factor [Anaerolineales bacterium]